MRKPEDIQNALGNIGDDLIEDAAHAIAATKKRAFAKRKWIPIIAATLVFAILIGVFLQPEEDILSIDTPHLNSAANANPKDSLHIVAKYPSSASHYLLFEKGTKEYHSAKTAWEKQKQEQKDLFESASLELDSFLNATMQEILTNSNGENKVCSPINLYLALSMLAEVTDENSREQILNLLGADDVETLRTQVNALWRSHYTDDGISTLTLGNSFWLNQAKAYKEEALKNLAEYYFATSHEGNPLNEDYVQLYRDWLNEQTRGLLKDTVDEEKFHRDMLVTLVSTIYFKASWESKFSQTREGIFHTPNGDVHATFMSAFFDGTAYRGKLFSSLLYRFSSGDHMWFILPKEGVEIDTVLCSTEYQEFMMDPFSKASKDTTVLLNVPKFDFSCTTDLIPSLQKLGITDVFDPEAADFSPLTPQKYVFVSTIGHNVRIKIDENGCEGTAYAKSEALDTSYPLIFNLDRPFLFAVTSQHNVPLFVGVVNDPTAS